MLLMEYSSIFSRATEYKLNWVIQGQFWWDEKIPKPEQRKQNEKKSFINVKLEPEILNV